MTLIDRLKNRFQRSKPEDDPLMIELAIAEFKKIPRYDPDKQPEFVPNAYDHVTGKPVKRIISHHPAVLAVAMHVDLMNFFGGLESFWKAYLAGAIKWFPPGDDSFEFRVFRGMLTSACGMAGDSGRMDETWKNYQAWQKGE